MVTEISRDVVDVGLRFTLQAPDDWLEYPNNQALLTLSGDLGQPPQSLRPSVQWNVIAAGNDPEAAFAGVRRDLMALPEADVISEEAGAQPLPFYSIALAFRNASTGAVQITLVHAQYAAGEPPVLVQAVGSCGGAAGAEVASVLAGILRSTRVTRLNGAE
jgi:hypothetical protein